ncbi:hypothetical protein K2Y11_21835 [bacterium]|nr:hypothetical protein [bacterium]
MSTAERRTGIRNTPRGQGVPATITIEGRDIPVLVVDESVVGTGAIAVNLPPTQIGATVHYRSKLSHKEARVSSLTPIEFTEASITRIGLEWID